jgi:hypothetical protein
MHKMLKSAFVHPCAIRASEGGFMDKMHKWSLDHVLLCPPKCTAAPRQTSYGASGSFVREHAQSDALRLVQSSVEEALPRREGMVGRGDAVMVWGDDDLAAGISPNKVMMTHGAV